MSLSCLDALTVRSELRVVVQQHVLYAEKAVQLHFVS